MSASFTTLEDEGLGEEIQPYRAVSKWAVASLVLSGLSLLGFMSLPLLVVPALGVLAGLYARRSIRRYPEELTGRIPALVGIALSGLFLAAGVLTLSRRRKQARVGGKNSLPSTQIVQ